MCGFAGWIDWERDILQKKAIIESMTDCMSHRGPDDRGFFFTEHAALGHRRLVVVDPLGGRQPMQRSFRGQTCTIVYNGELYNTSEIRSMLQSRGWNFETLNSDTEVLLLAFMEWGPGCLRYFNGIFAFAVWEHERQNLFMARDRLGVKPLFYTAGEGGLIFASELKSLLRNPHVEPVVDETGLAELLIMGPSRTPGTGLFKGIKEVRPGWSLSFNRAGEKLEQYWRLTSNEHVDDLATTAKTVAEIFSDAVFRQTRADVPVATFLSGGLDSSAVTALAVPALQEQGFSTPSFSVDYIDNDKYFMSSLYQQDADFMWVEQAAQELGSLHHSVLLNNLDLADSLLDALRANDYPGMADIDSSLLLFCRAVKKKVTVALSGECADEIFGGYPWFHWEDQKGEGFPWIRDIEQRLVFINPGLGSWIKPYCKDYLLERYREALREVPELRGESPIEAQKRQLLYLCITRFMPTLLDRKDRMSMATGLEVRVPFADHRLIEYVWNVPWEMKNCSPQAKGLLRLALKGIVPEFILNRPKSPYPKTHNPEYFNIVRQRTLDILNDRSSPLREIIDADFIEGVMREQRPLYDKPWFGQLLGEAQYYAWLIQLNSWLEEYKVQICI